MKHIYIALILLMFGCAGPPQSKSEAGSDDALQIAIEETMSEARSAIDQFGETDEAMTTIQAALAKLARQPGLKDRADLDELHGSSSMAAAALASEGENRITLFIVRFAANSSTPVHDHLTWGVIHVLEGRDRYIQWERLADGTAHDRAELRVKSDRILEPGQSVYWLAPPNDIHSQESLSSVVWELVLSGKNLIADGITQHRHYFDPKTGRVTKAKAQ